jgi:hypothetical protein
MTTVVVRTVCCQGGTRDAGGRPWACW